MVAILLGWALLGETPPSLAALGGALCVAGVYLARGPRMPARRRSERGGHVTYDVVHAHALEWKEREPLFGQEPRRHASITDGARLTQSRAQMWRYPAHTRGRRHVEPDQEEVFVPLRGTLTVLVDEPPRRVDVEPGAAIAVHPGTPVQLRNETDEEILLFAYGAPPIAGSTRFLDDVDAI